MKSDEKQYLLLGHIANLTIKTTCVYKHDGSETFKKKFCFSELSFVLPMGIVVISVELKVINITLCVRLT